MATFTTKPFEIEAVQYYHDQNLMEVTIFTEDQFRVVRKPKDEIVAEVWDEIHKTWVGVRDNDWIIRGMAGEYYPCAPSIFEAKYERKGPQPNWKVVNYVFMNSSDPERVAAEVLRLIRSRNGGN